MRIVTLPPGVSRLLPDSITMRALDNETIAAGTSAAELMERAGQGVAQQILRDIPLDATITVLCGSGNNGGDGLVIARVIRESGFGCAVFVVSSPRHTPEFNIHAQSAGEVHFIGERQSNYPAEWISAEMNLVRSALESSDVVIDALLGVGQKHPPAGAIESVVVLLNELRSKRTFKIISVDVPTGVDCNNGGVFDLHVTADATICIELIKCGLTQFPAREAAGTLSLVPIGISGNTPVDYKLLDEETAPKLAARQPNAHKGIFGHLLVIGGSANFPGAPELTARAGIRCGAALVTRCSPLNAWIHSITPEVMRCGGVSSQDGFAEGDFEGIAPTVARCNSFAVGPGIGQAKSTVDFVLKVLTALGEKSLPVVVDADALNAVAVGRAHSLLKGMVITPHPGEAARLLNVKTSDISKDRFSAIEELENLTGAIVVLKGAGTLIRWKGGCYVSDSADPYLATGGSGDVLTGIIGSLMAQKMKPEEAALLGVIVHTRAAVKAVEKTGGPIIASDLIEAIPAAVNAFTERR